MILALLLTELTHRNVHLTIEQDRLKVEVPPQMLPEDLRQAMAEQKAALHQFAVFPFVETVDGLGMLTGNTQVRDLFLVAEERQEALRYRIGVVSLDDDIERFYYPHMVFVARSDEPQILEDADLQKERTL